MKTNRDAVVRNAIIAAASLGLAFAAASPAIDDDDVMVQDAALDCIEVGSDIWFSLFG